MNAEAISKPTLIWIGLILAAGIFLRLYPSTAGEKVVGFDETIYVRYVNVLMARGLGSYPAMSEGYIEAQKELPDVFLPPTRFFYIWAGYTWHSVFGTEPRTALHRVSSLFTILTLFLSTLFAARLGGGRMALGVAALMACAPMQIHMSQHPLIDGVFAFWALLSLFALWENLRNPDSIWRLALLAFSLGVMVLTKENAAFVYVSLLAVVAANRLLHFGKVTPKLLIILFIGPALGIALLFLLAGGPMRFIEIYKLVVQKASVLSYAIKYCDGPWYRYLIDFLLLSPLVVLLAIGEIFRLDTGKKAALCLVTFLAASFAFMSSVKYSLNLRYALMWDMPLRFLAFSQLAAVSAAFRRYQRSALIVLTTAVCLFELNQFNIFFIQCGLYEPVTEVLERAARILK